MKSKAFVVVVLVILCSVLADEKVSHDEITSDETKHTNTFGGGGGLGGHGGGSAGGHSGGFSHGGAYGGGKVCKFGCCSKSYGYSHKGGGYYGCTCCATFAEAKAYKDKEVAKAKAESESQELNC